MKNINSRLDSVDHIRIDGNAITNLGRQLSIDYPRPFFHPMYGSFISVSSAVAWYKLKNKDNVVRNLRGSELRVYLDKIFKEGKNEYEQRYIEDSVFESFLKYSIASKPSLMEMFSKNNLPYVAYYIDQGNHLKLRDKRMTIILNKVRQGLPKFELD